MDPRHLHEKKNIRQMSKEVLQIIIQDKHQADFLILESVSKKHSTCNIWISFFMQLLLPVIA